MTKPVRSALDQDKQWNDREQVAIDWISRNE